MKGRIAAGLVKLACDAIQRRYGLKESDLLSAARLDPSDLEDPSAPVPSDAFYDVLRCALDRTRDPALGLRMADAVDLRGQGFWGYALLSSVNFRERLERHLRYQELRFPCELSFRVEGGSALLEFAPRDTPDELLPVVLDWCFAVSCIQQARHARTRAAEMSLWLSYREQPHHRALRALVTGAVVFDAPCNRMEFAARDLELPLDGDPHLGKLAVAQLEAQLAQDSARAQRDTRDEVRERLLARLSVDPSLERVARDLRTTPRTLRRQLSAAGSSFQELLDEVRRARAIAWLSQGDDSIEVVAARLGYSDPSNFRRAFRRWTGISPATFRAQSRARALPLAANDLSFPLVSLPHSED